MNGLHQRIAQHVSTDAERAKMLALLVELNDALGGAYHQPQEMKSVWDAGIKAWDNKKGFDIHLRTVCDKDKFCEVVAMLEKKLEVTFETSSHRPYSTHWQPNVRIYVDT